MTDRAERRRRRRSHRRGPPGRPRRPGRSRRPRAGRAERGRGGQRARRRRPSPAVRGVRRRRVRLRPAAVRPGLRDRAAPGLRHWFRVEVRGIEHVPSSGAGLVVANHSGTLPLDAIMTQLAIQDEHPADRRLRLLGADLVFSLPFVGELARKGGSTLACAEDAARLLEAGELVGVFPEGFKGTGKLFSERYKLQRFGRGGFVSAALRTGTPLIPCSIVGAEETYPMLADVEHAGACGRAAVPPDHADVPVARPARAGAAPVEVDHRVRRAGRHVVRTTRRRRTTPRSCST